MSHYFNVRDCCWTAVCAVCPVELTDIIIIHVLIGVGFRFVAEFERVKLAACERGDRADQPSWVINHGHTRRSL